MKSLSKLSMMLLMAVIIFGGSGCKSQKKLAKEKAKKEAEARVVQVSRSTKELNDILNDDSMTLEEKQRAVDRIKAMNLGDANVNGLISQIEDQLEAERAALKSSEGNSGGTRAQRLGSYFSAVANSNNINAANNNIEETLGMFSSPEALVLIIISKSGDVMDYDRPTTIKKYLNYLKDQKVNHNAIHKVILDSNGKIKELELIKK